MVISQTTLFFIGLFYLGSLFILAYITDRGFIPKKLVDHPFVFILSLGVYASTWAIYGAVGFAHESGYNYLTFYLGISIAFFLAPVLLSPLFNLAKTYQLTSLADLIVFRYRSPMMGRLITIFMLIGLTPALAAQIQAVADSVHYLTQGSSKNELAIIFCIFITLFTITFGARHFSNENQKHDGLVMAIAAESLFKLIAMLVIAGFCIYYVFDGPDELNIWLRNNPKNISNLYEPLIHGNWHSLILIFFVAAFSMPHMYHMTFTENHRLKSIYHASWGFPLYLLLMAICIPPVLWSGYRLFPEGDSIPPDFFTVGIGIATQNPSIAILAYLAGVSAASGVIIVSTLALASMCLNHLVIPMTKAPTSGTYLYNWLRWQKYLLIIVIISASYAVFRIIDHQQTLSQLTLLAFIASVQFLPAVMGVLFWRGANRYGLFSGLLAGFVIWMVSFYLPLLIELDPLGLFGLIGIQFTYDGIQLNNSNWHIITVASVFINGLFMVIVSLLTPSTEEELLAAEQCSQDLFSRQKYRQLSISNAEEFILRLSLPLGEDVAFREVTQAMSELGLNPDENRSFALQKLRNRVEINLSRLFGAAHAQEVIKQHIPYTETSPEEEDIYVMEGRLEEYQYRLTGLAAELNNLRKFHRQTLYDLPSGVCSLAYDGEIVSWNYALQSLTGVAESDIIGAQINSLPNPWREFLQSFIDTFETDWHRKKLMVGGQIKWLNLHKAAISEKNKPLQINPKSEISNDEQTLSKPPNKRQHKDGMVILIEDVTDVLQLETKLTHSERLASIGRLAAGVAHEIGNPVTGIDCLAQNLLYDISKEQDRISEIDKEAAITLPSDSKEMLEEIRQQTQRITSIVQSLVNFSHAGSSDRDNSPVSLTETVEEGIKLLRLNLKGRNVRFENLCEPKHIVMGDGQLLIQVFINLFSNAIDAFESISETHEGVLQISSHRLGNYIKIEVTDNGPGIPNDLLENIFEPFVTTKDPGKGTGLGLALVHGIIEDHYGSISIENLMTAEKGLEHAKKGGSEYNHMSQNDLNAPEKIKKTVTGTRVSISLPSYTED